MRRTRPLCVAIAIVLLVVAASPVFAQLNRPLHRDGWILAAARAPGLEGSIWRTDLWLYARDAGARVTLRFCRSGADGGSAPAHTVDLTGGRQVLQIEDVVEHFLGVGSASWVGAIHYSSATPIQAWARVYSISPDGSRSFGQLIEGIPTADMTPDNDPWIWQEQQWLNALKHTADGRFRVNVGWVNPTAVAATSTARLWAEDGGNPPGGMAFRTVQIPAFSMVQLTDPFAEINGGEWNDYSIRVEVWPEGAGIFAYASVVDNATNDAYFVRGVKRYGPADHTGLNCTEHRDGWIMAAARSPGLHGSIWRTDLWITTGWPQPTSITLDFNRSSREVSEGTRVEVPITGEAEIYYFEDVVDHFLNPSEEGWVGAIHYVADADVQVWARVYSISADGRESFGQLVEGVPTADMAPAGSGGDPNAKLLLVPVRHTPGRFRANIGVVNPTAVRCDYVVTLYGSDGNAPPWDGPRSANVTVAPYSMVQLSDPFAGLNGGDWGEVQVMVRALTAGGGALAYASVVDNATNDAFFARGIKPLPVQGEE